MPLLGKEQRGNDYTFNNFVPLNQGTITDLSNIYNLARLPLQDNSNLLLNVKGTYFITSNTDC